MAPDLKNRNARPPEEFNDLPEPMASGSKGTQGMDSRYRSLAKAISWRVVALIVTFSVVWVVTGEVAFAVAAGLLDAAFKIGLYYLHERAWDRLKFGRGSQLGTR